MASKKEYDDCKTVEQLIELIRKILSEPPKIYNYKLPLEMRDNVTILQKRHNYYNKPEIIPVKVKEYWYENSIRAEQRAIQLWENDSTLTEPKFTESHGKERLNEIVFWGIRSKKSNSEKDGRGRGHPKEPEAEKSIDNLRELLKNESNFSAMPRDTRVESWEWIADKIGYPKKPENDTRRYKIMQGYLRRNCLKLYKRLKEIVEKN